MKKLLITTLIIILLAFPAINAVSATEDPTFYAITQLSTTTLVETIKGEEGVSAEAFYDLRSASGHTPFMEEQISKIYLYEDSLGEVSLIIHHSIDNSESAYMRVDFDLEGVPDEAYVAVSDDESHTWPEGPTGGVEFALDRDPEGQWEFYHNSDGGVLGGLPTDTQWKITITPDFIAGIIGWKYQETELTTTTLDMLEPIIISSDLSNVSPDEDVGLSFDGLLSGGSIGVTRLFGCTTSELPTAFFDIRVTVTFGIAQICVNYDDSQLNKGQEKNLRLWVTDHIIPGDVNFDGDVNHKDIQSIKQAIKLWNDNPDDPNIINNGHGNGWNPYTDINCDGVVDEFDLAIAVSNLDESPSPWFDITTGINTDLNMLYGETDHFSIFRGR